MPIEAAGYIERYAVMREFILSYDFGEGSWMVGIMAESLEDAARRVQAIRRSATLLGSSERFTPVEVEYRGERHLFDQEQKGEF